MAWRFSLALRFLLTWLFLLAWPVYFQFQQLEPCPLHIKQFCDMEAIYAYGVGPRWQLSYRVC